MIERPSNPPTRKPRTIATEMMCWLESLAIYETCKEKTRQEGFESHGEIGTAQDGGSKWEILFFECLFSHYRCHALARKIRLSSLHLLPLRDVEGEKRGKRSTTRLDLHLSDHPGRRSHAFASCVKYLHSSRYGRHIYGARISTCEGKGIASCLKVLIPIRKEVEDDTTSSQKASKRRLRPPARIKAPVLNRGLFVAFHPGSGSTRHVLENVTIVASETCLLTISLLLLRYHHLASAINLYNQ